MGEPWYVLMFGLGSFVWGGLIGYWQGYKAAQNRNKANEGS